MSGEGGGEEKGEGKLPSVDHGRRTDKGRDEKRVELGKTNCLTLRIVRWRLWKRKFSKSCLV